MSTVGAVAEIAVALGAGHARDAGALADDRVAARVIVEERRLLRTTGS
jgi:hypothetical protein